VEESFGGVLWVLGRLFAVKQVGQWKNDVTLRRVLANIVAVEKQ
jgi:hypothetical protein